MDSFTYWPTSQVSTPDGWANAAHKAHEEWHADAIIAEKNYGGDMVRHTLESTGRKDVRVILVDSRRGKCCEPNPSWEPMSDALVKHVSSNRSDLVALESEMVEWVPGIGASPTVSTH